MAIRTISTRMAIEGEAQYKQAISACNGELKTLKSSLALVESSFRGNANSMEALTEKGKVLADMHTQQEAKVQELQKALENSQNYQKKYADAAAEAGKKVEECSAALEALKSSAEYTRPEQQALTKELNNWKKAQEDAEASNYAAAKSVQEWKQQINKAKIEQNDLKEAIQNNNQYLEEAAAAQASTALPLILVGGIFSRTDAEQVLAAGIPFVSFSRALICQPDFVARLRSGELDESACLACNGCYSIYRRRPVRCVQHSAPIPQLEKVFRGIQLE